MLLKQGLGAEADPGVPEPPPPPPTDCECERAFEEKLADCTGPAGNLSPECLEGAERETERCWRTCKASPEEICYLACEDALNEALLTCNPPGADRDGDGLPDRGEPGEPEPGEDGVIGVFLDGEADECFHAAFERFDDCHVECQPEEVRCANDCRRTHSDALRECSTVEDPEERLACMNRSDDDLVACTVDCGASEDSTCYLRCEIDYVRGLEACAGNAGDGLLGDRDGDGIPDGQDGEGQDGDGNVDADVPPLPDIGLDGVCAERVHIAFERCQIGCDVENEEELCGISCDLDFREALLDCEGEECEQAEARYSECLAACGIVRPEPPEPDPCFLGCEGAFEEALAECEASGDPDGQCFGRVHFRFERCVLSCEDDGERECPRLCDLDFEEIQLDCDGEECDAAREAYEGCLRGCGIDVPELPEPDPCLSGCDRRFHETLERCYEGIDPGADGRVAGEPLVQEPSDDECFAAADAAYVACLSRCGVEIPAPPPAPGPEVEGCSRDCDHAYEQAFISCFDEATGEVHRECVRRTDRRYLECLSDCGVELPEEPELPGPSGNPCVAGCDETLLGGILDCYDASGELSLDCILALVATFEECRSSCASADQDSVLAAALRESQSEVLFLRGDASRNGDLELTDAVLALDYLFIRNVTTTCPDAFDSNDDGSVNIVDPIRLLGRLFLGSDPLPAPSDAPGRDPTPDSLSCR